MDDPNASLLGRELASYKGAQIPHVIANIYQVMPWRNRNSLPFCVAAHISHARRDWDRTLNRVSLRIKESMIKPMVCKLHGN